MEMLACIWQKPRLSRFPRFPPVFPIEGGWFGDRKPSGEIVALADVKLRYPCEPPKVLCVGLNYKSHLGDRPAPRSSATSVST